MGVTGPGHFERGRSSEVWGPAGWVRPGAPYQEVAGLRRELAERDRELADLHRKVSGLRGQVRHLRRALGLNEAVTTGRLPVIDTPGHPAWGRRSSEVWGPAGWVRPGAPYQEVAGLRRELAERDRELAALRGELAELYGQMGSLRRARLEVAAKNRGPVVSDLKEISSTGPILRAFGSPRAERSWEEVCLEGAELDKVLGPEAGLREIRLVRVRIFYKGSAEDLWIHRDVLSLPPSERSEIVEWIHDEGVGGVAEYMAKKADPILDQSSFFRVGSVSGLDSVAQDVGKLQEGWHEFLIGDPVKKLASALRLPDASLVGNVAGSLPVGLIDRPAGEFKLAFEIGAVATAIVTGPTALVAVGAKLLFKDLAHRAVAASIKSLFTNDGQRRQQSDPARSQP